MYFKVLDSFAFFFRSSYIRSINCCIFLGLSLQLPCLLRRILGTVLWEYSRDRSFSLFFSVQWVSYSIISAIRGGYLQVVPHHRRLYRRSQRLKTSERVVDRPLLISPTFPSDIYYFSSQADASLKFLFVFRFECSPLLSPTFYFSILKIYGHYVVLQNIDENRDASLNVWLI